MFYKFFCIFLSFFIFSCVNFENFFYCSKFNQGNYLSDKDIKNIKVGIKKKKVIEILGYPVINDFLNENILYYISYKKLGCNNFKKKRLILFFDKNDVLIKIQN